MSKEKKNPLTDIIFALIGIAPAIAGVGLKILIGSNQALFDMFLEGLLYGYGGLAAIIVFGTVSREIGVQFYARYTGKHPDKLNCYYCEKTFDSEKTLGAHIGVKHCSEDVTVCQVCGKEFDTDRGLQIHQLQKHNGADTE